MQAFIVFTCLVMCASALVIEKADREFDMTGHLLKVEDKLIVLGSDKTEHDFEYQLSADLGPKAVYFEASGKAGDKRERLTATPGKDGSKTSWKIKFSQPLASGERAKVQITVVFAGVLRPYPKEIKQSEKQKILFTGNAHLYSPYEVKAESVRFSLPTTQIESYTKTKPVTVSDNTITYGPYENLKAFSEFSVSVHCENNKPFLSVRSMKRIVDVSLWGSNIAIEEHYEVYHSGAVLNGPFSRYDYQIHQDGVSSIKSFKTVLPAAARDIYYRDEIGNISTSNVREMTDGVEMEIRPRFPLFGGWKTVYYIGYNIPAYQFLYKKDGHYALKMPFVDHVYDDQYIEDFTLKVILPESADILKFYPPFSVERRPNEAKNVYFDFTDSIVRPIFVANAKNLVEQHIQDYTLEFNYRSIYLLRQPLLFTTAAMVLFITVIIFFRLDFAITRDAQAEAKMRASSHSEAIMRQVKALKSHYNQFTEIVGKFKTTKEAASFLQARKRVEHSMKTAADELGAIRDLIKKESAEFAENVNEILRADSAVHEILQKHVTAVEKFANGKTDKARFTTEEDDLRGLLRESVGRLDTAAGHFA